MRILHQINFRLFCFTALLLWVAASFSGCNDDEAASPKLELTVADQTYSLKNARILFMRDGGTEGESSFLYRHFVITDGEIVSGYGYTKEDYENATYFIVIQIGVPSTSELSIGEFPLYRHWGSAPSGSNVCFLTSNFNLGSDDQYYVSPQTVHDPLIVSGGLNPDEKISITFNGTIQHERADATGTSWLVTDEACTLKFTGKVVDGRVPH